MKGTVPGRLKAKVNSGKKISKPHAAVYGLKHVYMLILNSILQLLFVAELWHFISVITCHLLGTECKRRGKDWVTVQKSRCLLHGILVWCEYDLSGTKNMQLYDCVIFMFHCTHFALHYFRPTDIKWPNNHQMHFNIIHVLFNIIQFITQFSKFLTVWQDIKGLETFYQQTLN